MKDTNNNQFMFKEETYCFNLSLLKRFDFWLGLIICGLVAYLHWLPILNKCGHLPVEMQVMERFNEDYAVTVFHNANKSFVYDNADAGINYKLFFMTVFPYISFKFFGLNGLVASDIFFNIFHFFMATLLFSKILKSYSSGILMAIMISITFNVIILGEFAGYLRNIAYQTSGFGRLILLIIIAISLALFFARKYMIKNNHYWMLVVSMYSMLISIYLSYVCCFDDYWRVLRPFYSHGFIWGWLLGLILLWDGQKKSIYLIAFFSACVAQLDPYVFISLLFVTVLLMLYLKFWSFIGWSSLLKAFFIFLVVFLPMIYSLYTAEPYAEINNFFQKVKLNAIGYIRIHHFIAIAFFAYLLYLYAQFNLRVSRFIALLLLYIFFTIMTPLIVYYTVKVMPEPWHYYLLNDKVVFGSAGIVFLFSIVFFIQMMKINFENNKNKSCFLILSIFLIFLILINKSGFGYTQNRFRYSAEFHELSAYLQKFKKKDMVLGTIEPGVFWLWNCMGGYSLIPGAFARMSVYEVDKYCYAFFRTLGFSNDQFDVFTRKNDFGGRIIPLYNDAFKDKRRGTDEFILNYKNYKHNNYKLDIIVIDSLLINYYDEDKLKNKWILGFKNNKYRVYVRGTQ
jgi:hypothetical protein